MIRIFRILALLVAVLTLTTIVHAQSREESLPVDIGVTYVAERAKIASVSCGCFWLQGGSADGAVTLYRGLGVAVNFAGEHSSNIASGVDLNKFSLVAGPRYTLETGRWTTHIFGSKHASSVFGEALFGYARGFDSLFPSSTGGTKTSARSIAMQIGGGLNVGLTKHFGLRAFEVDYVRTSLPNNSADTQNDLRLAIGVVYHIRGR
jgi:hypothetical protein